MSPYGSQPITMMLPFISSDALKCICYSSNLGIALFFKKTIERIFLLRNHGDIWLISTTHNPCKLVDIWNSGELTRENVSQLCVYEGKKSKWMINPDDIDFDSGFTFILGATETGQVLIFENDGFIGSRTQVCDKNLITGT
jgi:hypothetical protein